jgi:1-acyl-sn-glycerol-3-phosphate acyltransferase
MKALLRKVWAGYAVVLFLLMMLVLSLPIMSFHMIVTPGERALRKNLNFLYHWFTPIFLTLVGVRMRVTGLENIRTDQSAVIIGNHRSALDFIVHCHSYPGVFRFLAKQELTKVPIFGWVVGKMCLIVDRSSPMSRARSMVALKEHLAHGWSIFIYPEGSRNKTTEPLATFYDGAFRLAIQSKAPLAMVVIKNISDITSSAKSVDLSPGTLYIHWCGMIDTSGYTADQMNELKDAAREMMERELRG